MPELETAGGQTAKPPSLKRPAAVAAPAEVAAYDARTPTLSQPAATLEPQAVAKYDYANTHLKAQWLEVSSGRTNEMFQFVDPGALKQVPFTLAHTTFANQDEGLTYAVNDSVTWISTVYGDSTLGSLVASNLIQDPLSRQRTQSALLGIGEADIATPNYLAGGYTGVNTDQAQAALQDALSSSDPVKALTAMDPATAQAVQSLAMQFYTSIQEAARRGDPLADQFARVVAVAQNGYSVALDSKEQQALRQMVQLAQSGLGGTTQELPAEITAKLGVSQIRRRGQGVLVLDQDWARAHPDEALAIQEFLQAQYPGATIQLGRQGIIGSLLDKSFMTIDYATAGIGAVVHQTGELYQQITTDPQEAASQLTEARKAEIAYNSDGTVTPWLAKLMTQWGANTNDPQAVQLAIDHVKEGNTFDVGLQSFWKDLYDNTRPDMVGFGLADNVTRGQGLLPGDPNYNFTHTAIGIVSQFIFDPAMWGPAVLGGLRDAGVASRLIGEAGGIPKIMDAAGVVHELKVSNSIIHQAVYSTFARTADEVMQTGAFINHASAMADVARATESEGALATLLVHKAGMKVDDAQRMATILWSPNVPIEQARASAGIALLDDALGNSAVDTIDRHYNLSGKLDEVNAALSGSSESAALATGYGEAAHIDLLAEKHTLESILAGHEPIRDPLQGIMGGKQIRRLQQAAGLPISKWDEAWDAIGHSIAEFPANVFIRNSEDLARLEEVNPKAAPSIQAMFAKLGHIWRDPGFARSGERFVLRDATDFTSVQGVEEARQALNAAEASGDARRIGDAQKAFDSAVTQAVTSPDDSLDRLSNIAREVGLPDQRYRKLIEPYVSGSLDGDLAGQRQWFLDTWKKVIDESPQLDGLAKKGLRDLYETWGGDRLGTRISIEGSQGDWTREAVLTRKQGLAPGVKPYAMPTIDADLGRSIPIPSLGEYRSYATVTGRTMKAWEESGKVLKWVSTTHGKLANAWRTSVSWWRSWILGQRILFALPARIVGEQQLRMAAFGYDSAVWHFGEWFKSTTWGEKFFKDDAALHAAAGSPTHALGTMVDDIRSRVIPTLDKSMAGLETGVAADEDAFFRAYSQFLTKYASSSSVKRWRLAGGVGDEIATPEEVLRAIGQETYGPLRDTWMREFGLTRAVGDTRPEAEIVRDAVNRWDTEIHQVIGRDEEDIVKRALLDRKTVIDGEDFQVGTSEFAKKLQELYHTTTADGVRRWEPGIRELPTQLGHYLPGDSIANTKGLTNKLFRMFYSAPDLATSRMPLYRQMFKRNYENFLRLGYDDQRAVEAAQALAAQGTADLLFQLGTHTNGEYMLREIMPFFPAYRELATTWIGRIPERLGALKETHAAAVGWVVGASALAERANLVMKSAEQLGIVHRQADGSYYLNVPGIGSLLSWLTFDHVHWDDHVPLASIAGLLPIPFNASLTDDQGQPLPLAQRLTGALPTIGGPPVEILAALKGFAPGFFGPVEDWVTPFGSDQSIGVPLIDLVWEGVTGHHSPFAIGKTETLHNAQIQSAKTDGLRLALHETPMPVWPGPHLTKAQSDAYIKEWNDWRRGILQKGDQYQQNLYLLKAGVGAVLPFSISFSDQYKSEVAAMWKMINVLPGGQDSSVAKAEMQLYLSRNPGLEPFITAKGLDTRLYDDPHNSIAAYNQAVADGAIIIRNSNQWTVYAVATNAYAEHMATVAAIRHNAGSTWQEVLMNMDAKQQLSDEQDRWNAFLDYNHNHMADLGMGNMPDMRTMLDVVRQYQGIRAGKEPTLTLDQQRLIDFDQTMRHYARYFDYNPEHAGAYAKLRSDAYDALFKSLGPPSETSQQIGDWFKNTADPYFKKLDTLYGSLKTADPADQENIYSAIRKVSDRYDALARQSGDPTPEEYIFARKNPAEQRQTVAKWAAMDGTWLTAFQRRQVDYQGDDTNLTLYSNYAASLDTRMRKVAADNGITVNTTAWDDLVKQRDGFLATRADKLGVTDTVKAMNAPTYVRIGHALDLHGNPGWDRLTQDVRTIEHIAAGLRGGDGVSMAGTTVEATSLREQLFKYAEEARASNPELDKALNDIAVALDEPTNSGLYDHLFFDKTF